MICHLKSPLHTKLIDTLGYSDVTLYYPINTPLYNYKFEIEVESHLTSNEIKLIPI